MLGQFIMGLLGGTLAVAGAVLIGKAISRKHTERKNNED